MGRRSWWKRPLRLKVTKDGIEMQGNTGKEMELLTELSQRVQKPHEIKVSTSGLSSTGYGESGEKKALLWVAIALAGLALGALGRRLYHKYIKKSNPVIALPAPPVIDVPCVEVPEDGCSEDDELPEGAAVTKPKSWYDRFHERFIMPTNLPEPILDIILRVPDRHQDAMLLQLLCMFGALTSKVRAKYLDGKMHSPSLQVVIEGKSGSGKSVFNTVYQTLFRRLIDRDNAKLSQGLEHKIVQNIGVTITKPKFNQVLAGNDGVHMFMFDSEISNIARALKGSGGLTYEILRYAFDNDAVYQNNMANNAVAGYFKVYLNCFATGTPVDCDAFVKNQLTTGTIQRFCYGVLPSPEKDEDFTLNLPDGPRLSEIHDFIDDLCKMYCFTTDDQSNDHAVGEVNINLDYVNNGIDEWIRQQKKQAEDEDNPARRENCNRIGAMAFRAAMVLHILYIFDVDISEQEKQNSVREMAIYVANYCMERFLHKFQTKLNLEIRENDRLEQAIDTSMDTDKLIERDVLALWDSGVKNQAEITRRLKDKYGDDIYPMKVGRLLKINNRI